MGQRLRLTASAAVHIGSFATTTSEKSPSHFAMDSSHVRFFTQKADMWSKRNITNLRHGNPCQTRLHHLQLISGLMYPCRTHPSHENVRHRTDHRWRRGCCLYLAILLAGNEVLSVLHVFRQKVAASGGHFNCATGLIVRDATLSSVQCNNPADGTSPTCTFAW